MASIIDSFSEALNDRFALVKFIVYAIPVYIVAERFVLGRMAYVQVWGPLVLLLLIAVLTQAINNVRLCRTEILTLNPVRLVKALGKALLVLVPHVLVLGYIGYVLTGLLIFNVSIPHFNLIIHTIIWAIMGSIVLTSYLSFAKYLRISQGYNYRVIFESCVDVLVSLIFYSPQLVIAFAILVAPVWYVLSILNIPLTHWAFVAYCSIIFVIFVSIMANYFAQSAYEQIKGNNEDYDDNYNRIDFIDDVAERLNGK